MAQEARVDSVEFAYRSAASKYAEAANLVAPFDTQQQWAFLLGQADALYKQGEEFGENTALAEAIEVLDEHSYAYEVCVAAFVKHARGSVLP